MNIQDKIAMNGIEKAGQYPLRVVKERFESGLSHRRKIRNVHFCLRVVKDSTRTLPPPQVSGGLVVVSSICFTIIAWLVSYLGRLQEVPHRGLSLSIECDWRIENVDDNQYRLPIEKLKTGP